MQKIEKKIKEILIKNKRFILQDGFFEKGIKKRAKIICSVVFVILIFLAIFMPEWTYKDLCSKGKYVFDNRSQDKNYYDASLGEITQIALCNSELKDTEQEKFVNFKSPIMGPNIDNEQKLKSDATAIMLHLFCTLFRFVIAYFAIFVLAQVLADRPANFLFQILLLGFVFFTGTFVLLLYVKMLLGWF
jgi:hypothetical protein